MVAVVSICLKVKEITKHTFSLHSKKCERYYTESCMCIYNYLFVVRFRFEASKIDGNGL